MYSHYNNILKIETSQKERKRKSSCALKMEEFLNDMETQTIKKKLCSG
jgi:hypothetical protein